MNKYSNELRVHCVFNHSCSGPGPNSVEGQAVVDKRNSLFSNHIHRPYSLNYSLNSFYEEKEEEEEEGREKGSIRCNSQQLDNNKSLSLSVCSV